MFISRTAVGLLAISYSEACQLLQLCALRHIVSNEDKPTVLGSTDAQECCDTVHAGL